MREAFKEINHGLITFLKYSFTLISNLQLKCWNEENCFRLILPNFFFFFLNCVKRNILIMFIDKFF